MVGVEGRSYRLRVEPAGSHRLAVGIGGRRLLVHYIKTPGGLVLHVEGHTVECEVEHAGSPPVRSQDAGALRAPMPGVVTHVAVREGDRVRSGHALLVVEAMKMEHVIRAPHEGVVRRVHVQQGQQVDGGAVVVEIDGMRERP